LRNQAVCLTVAAETGISAKEKSVSLLAYLLILALTAYLYTIIAAVIINWLVVLQVMNLRNPIAFKIHAVLRRLTEPSFKAVQKILPPVGGFDLSPIVLIIGITVLQRMLYGLM